MVVPFMAGQPSLTNGAGAAEGVGAIYSDVVEVDSDVVEVDSDVVVEDSDVVEVDSDVVVEDSDLVMVDSNLVGVTLDVASVDELVDVTLTGYGAGDKVEVLLAPGTGKPPLL